MTFMCTLLNGPQVLDDHCTCTFSRISAASMFADKLEGEGSISILTLWPFELRGSRPRQFTLRFKGAFVPQVGKLEDVPIVLIPDDLVGSRTATFRIGRI